MTHPGEGNVMPIPENYVLIGRARLTSDRNVWLCILEDLRSELHVNEMVDAALGQASAKRRLVDLARRADLIADSSAYRWRKTRDSRLQLWSPKEHIWPEGEG